MRLTVIEQVSSHKILVYFFDVVLHDYNVKLPSYTSFVGNVVCAHQSFVACVPVQFVFHCHLFSPCWWLAFLIFSPPISMFFLRQKSSPFFYLALSLFSMSVQTLKFSRTRLCCLFFSLLWLSPDRLSLSKKSGWKKPRVAFAIPVD